MVAFSPLSPATPGIGNTGAPAISRVRSTAAAPAPSPALATGRGAAAGAPGDGSTPSRTLPRGSLLDLSV